MNNDKFLYIEDIILEYIDDYKFIVSTYDKVIHIIPTLRQNVNNIVCAFAYYDEYHLDTFCIKLFYHNSLDDQISDIVNKMIKRLKRFNISSLIVDNDPIYDLYFNKVIVTNI